MSKTNGSGQSPAPRPSTPKFLEVSSAGRRYVSDRRFFAERPYLEDLARRALARASDASLSFLDSHGGSLMRVTLEATSTLPRTVRLETGACQAPYGLTTRELQVATCMAGGLTTPEIAAALGCTRRTASTHAEHVLTKCGLRSRAAVATLITALQAHTLPVPAEALVLPPALAEVLSSTPRPPSPPPPQPHPITVGLIYPDGPTASGVDHLHMRQGALLALDELEQRGGPAGRRVRFALRQATPDALPAALEEMIVSGAHAVLLGNQPAQAAREALALAADAGTPIMHSMIAPSLTDAVFHNPRTLGHVFQATADESSYLRGFLRTLGLLKTSGSWRPRGRRLALLLRRSTITEVLSEDLRDAVSAAGWDLAVAESVDEQHTSWEQIAERLEEADPDAVFLSVMPEPVLRRFLEATTELRSRSLVHTAWAPTTPGFTERLGPLAEGLMWSTVVGVRESSVSDVFAQRYHAAYGVPPGLGAAAVHYDLVHVLAAAWAAVDRPWNHLGVQRYLRSTPHHGVAGTYSFSGRGQRGLAYPDDDATDPALAHPHLTYRIRHGRHRLLT
ncbi:ABC transporter substrate-binding protein [Streptomyces sparsogenes]|uniref:ABC transporter substrate-binding protein n=1 Tax=Streptomyces sparsogenes TaxID=67365 RepID=UPI0008243DC6|nr:ABC transporter substrate-binding protein [Streptomyces sparsogenes]